MTAIVDVSLIGTSSTDAASWPTFQNLQNALAVAFVFDLQDYGSGTSGPFSELSARIESTIKVLEGLNNRGPPSELALICLFSNFEKLNSQLSEMPFFLKSEQPTSDGTAVITEIESHFQSSISLPYISCILDKDESSEPKALLEILQRIGIQRNALPTVAEDEQDSDYDTLYADP